MPEPRLSLNRLRLSFLMVLSRAFNAFFGFLAFDFAELLSGLAISGGRGNNMLLFAACV